MFFSCDKAMKFYIEDVTMRDSGKEYDSSLGLAMW